MLKHAAISLIGLLMVAAAACSHSPANQDTTPSSTAAPAGDIVEVASSAGSFETLLAAAEAAELVAALKADGPITVFAPTDEAFAKLPEGTVDALLQDREKLTAILTYHVVPGRVMAADVIKLDSAKTLNGKSIGIDTRNGVRVDGANVIKTDVVASNGVIHVIDTVLIPE